MIHLPHKFFFWKKQYFFHLPIDPFHCAKFKKNNLRASPELWGYAIFAPKMIHLPKQEFFRKTSSWIFFLSSNLLMKYWWLKNTEISLSESCFRAYCENCMPGKNLVLKLYNLRTRFFPGMQFSQNVWEP